jgi:hypothetical protein
MDRPNHNSLVLGAIFADRTYNPQLRLSDISEAEELFSKFTTPTMAPLRAGEQLLCRGDRTTPCRLRWGHADRASVSSPWT